MTLMLASVNSLSEANLAYQAGADIIDLKQPSQGALGALDLNTIERICTLFAGRVPISATVGDLPMQPDLIDHAVRMMAITGVNYIKIGFFPGGDWLGVIQQLSMLAGHVQALIAVLFADTNPDPDWIEILHRADFKGVMLDTMDKSCGSLTTIMKPIDLERFTNEVKKREMLCGLAGSLRLDDITGLLQYRPDYLGFRGALCVNRDRTAELNKDQVARIKKEITYAHHEYLVN
jgi:(5-formylfuran-3-yl)methyl phosphate synthase